jgi:hypothetical protein
VDALHPDVVALVRGPLVLFALTPGKTKVSRAQLLAAQRTGTSPTWTIETGEEPLRMKPFWAIRDERYSLYLDIR